MKILITTLLLGLSLACSRRSGEQLGTYEKTNGVFAIRTSVYREKTFIPAFDILGAYYIFETKRQDEVTLREVMVFLDQSPEPFDVEQSKFVDRAAFVNDRMNFVNDQIAFVYMHWMYAVTTDGGATWKIWKGIDYPFSEGKMRYNGIQGVVLGETGAGTMKIKLIGNDDLTELHTKDYGVNWIADGN